MTEGERWWSVPAVMINKNRRVLTGLLSGAVGMSALAQDTPAPPSKPAEPVAEVVPAAVTPPVKPTVVASPPVQVPAIAAVDPFKAPADVAAAPADAIKTASGLASKVLKAGTGTVKPGSKDGVKVNYTGWTSADGKMFDSSISRGQPASFALDGVIKGWTEGIPLMVVGEKRRFWIPAALAYEGNPRGPQGMLVFDVELLEIMKQPETPTDLAAPPADAEKSESGLVSKVLKAGEGKEKPGPVDIAKVNFSGWKADGEFLVASIMNGQGPATMKIDQLPIKGWSEGIQQMVAGEKRRLWIPADLAFGDTPQEGAPAGPLVFDFELVSFEKYVDPYPAPADVAAAPADATKTESGLASKVLEAGEGDAKPTADDMVTFSFTGWKATGEFIGGSEAQGRPMNVKLADAPIPGWIEGIQLMAKGEKRRFWVPAELGFKGAPEKEALVFDVELLDFKTPPPPPAVPTDVAAAPADAEKTASGLASKVLTKGEGEKKPGPTSKVTVHYTGWTTDGKMFDSSVARGEPSSFGLNQVIKGWTEGLQLMVEGESRRFWIPVELAYQGQPGKPAGMLVFDVQLIKID